MSNGNQTLGGSYAHNNAPIVDLELRLGWRPSESQKSPFEVYICSYCSKHFCSLQALGGHQTAHRREMEELRRRQDANAKANSLHLALASKETIPLHHRYMGGGTPSFVGITNQLDLSMSIKRIELEAMSFINLELRLAAMENEIDLTLGL